MSSASSPPVKGLGPGPLKQSEQEWREEPRKKSFSCQGHGEASPHYRPRSTRVDIFFHGNGTIENFFPLLPASESGVTEIMLDMLDMLDAG